MALAARPIDRFMLVTDAMPTVGAATKTFVLNGQPIHVRAEDTDGNTWDQTFDAVNG